MSLLQIGSRGPAVVRLQVALSAAGFPAKPDGDFGPKTANAVSAYLVSVGASPAPVVDLTWVELYERPAVAPTATSSPGTPAVPAPLDLEALSHAAFEKWMVDRRAEHSPLVKSRATGKLVPYDPAPRAPAETTGVVLHQTACQMGERVARYDTIGAHFAVLRSGRVLRMADVHRVVYAANGFNARTVSIEIDGLFAGLEDDPDTALDEALRTTWDDPTTPTRETPVEPTDAQIRSVERLLRWLREEVGPGLRFCLSHRQSSEDRLNDPGQTVWRRTEAARKRLGLTDGGDGFCVGTGKPNPRQWDPARTGKY